jgi:hypothetical protein
MRTVQSGGDLRERSAAPDRAKKYGATMSAKRCATCQEDFSQPKTAQCKLISIYCPILGIPSSAL